MKSTITDNGDQAVINGVNAGEKNVVVLYLPQAQSGMSSARMPHAFFYLERVIRDLPVELIFIDGNQRTDYEPILKRVAHRLLLVGISTMTGRQITGGIACSKFARSISEAIIVWGGWHVTLLPDEVMMEDFIDLIIHGQGEAPFRELIIALLSGIDYSGIKGLGYKKEGKIIINDRAPFKSPFDFPKPDFSVIDLSKYLSVCKLKGKMVRYLATYGCPYNCYFCCQNVLFGGKWYPNSIANILEDLRYFRDTADVTIVKFDDDNFFVNRQFTIDLCTAMIENDIGLLCYAAGHPAHLMRHFSEDDFKLMYKAGLRFIGIGTESGDQDVLNLINKKSKVEDSLNCLKLLHKLGIRTTILLMFALPEAPDRDIELTIKFICKAKRIDPTTVYLLSLYTPYPGTKLFEIAKRNGFVSPVGLEEWARHTLKKFRAPWSKKRYVRKLHYLNGFYIPVSNPFLYREMTGWRKAGVLLITVLFYPVVYLRFRLNSFSFPFDAFLILGFIKFINLTFGKKFRLSHGADTYYD